MRTSRTKTLTVFAPAKINLFLHVAGRLDNGYHALDSLVAFSDIGDEIEIAPSRDFQFHATGPHAKNFSAKELDHSPNSSNIAAQAAWAMARAAQKILNVRIKLTKNLPLASGLGGGSSDAAAVIWGLAEWWDVPRSAHYIPGIAASLGSDIPACLACRPALLRGAGDVLDPAPAMSEVPIVLANPGRPCPTAQVFARFAGAFREPAAAPGPLENFSDLTRFLQSTHNDLLEPALEIAPEIRGVLEALESQKGCALARMSGSGATCFGLFENDADARRAARSTAARNPGWWVKAGWLNRPERY